MSEGKLIRGKAEERAVLQEHKERTEWRERHILAWGKTITLVLVGGGLSASLVVCACKTDNALQTLKELMPILTGVLSFIGGRMSR